MLVGCLNKGIRLDGFARGNLVEVHSIAERHQQLVEEMARRGYQHASPLPHFESEPMGLIPREWAYAELLSRCPECRKLATDE